MSSRPVSPDGAPRRHPIAITGMHRSGTSMITRGLHESGLHLIGGDADALLEAADDNPEGFWENKAIVACNDDLLEATGGAWDNPPRLPPLAVDDERVADVVERATAALDGLRENPHWGFKDPRLCLTAPFWLDLEPALRFVICVRHPLEVALSLKRRNQNSYSLGLRLWEQYYSAVLESVPVERRIVTHYDSFFTDPVGELRRLCDFAGLEAAHPHVRADLRHHEVGVGLEEANVGPDLRRLYAQLCDEAGVPAPPTGDEAATDGRVRRLVLDGAVAARHAEQRQQAIQRLEARLSESQAKEHELRLELGKVRREAASAEQSLRARNQTLQAELDAARGEVKRLSAIEERMGELVRSTQQLTDLTTMVAETTSATARRLETVEAAGVETLERIKELREAVAVRNRLRRAARRVLGQGRRRGVPAARAAARRLPSPARDKLRRMRIAYDDGVAVQRAREAADRAAGRLPAPARTVLAKGRAASRRLPAPVKDVAGRVTRLASPGAQQSPRGRAAPAAVTTPSPAPAPRARGKVPKGRPAREWQRAYERLVRAAVPAGVPWAVVTPGSPDSVREVIEPVGTRFPMPHGGPPLIDALSHVAVLEALRHEGHGHLVLPEGSRPWFRQQAELREILSRTYRTMKDEPGAGAVFDLTAPAAAEMEGTSLLAAVNSIAGDDDVAPAVLNLTDLDVTSELPGFTCFSPPAAPTLPYLEDSIDIVVVGPGGDAAEARRVATRAVVTVDAGGAARVEALDPDRGGTESDVVAYVAPTADERWRTAVGERATADGVGVVADEAALSGLRDDAVVIVVEPGVVPLPGALAAAARAVDTHPAAAVTGKVLSRTGTLDAAGGFVFRDGSVVGIGSGTDEVRAPWHEFVRPVCVSSGLTAARAELWRDDPPESFDPSGIAEWCGALWAADHPVLYQPRVTAVRVGAPVAPTSVARAWTRFTGSRPNRPTELRDGVWRYLLAHDDLEVPGR